MSTLNRWKLTLFGKVAKMAKVEKVDVVASFVASPVIYRPAVPMLARKEEKEKVKARWTKEKEKVKAKVRL